MSEIREMIKQDRKMYSEKFYQLSNSFAKRQRRLETRIEVLEKGNADNSRRIILLAIGILFLALSLVFSTISMNNAIRKITEDLYNPPPPIEMPAPPQISYFHLSLSPDNLDLDRVSEV